MSSNMPREIAVFIASPGDLAGERKVFKETIDTLNKGFADGANVKFVGLGWEDVLAETGRRGQAVINKEIDRSHVFILVLNRRWGQKAPDSKSTSYTEEEYEYAFQRWKNTKEPEVLVFFKNVDAASVADAGPELKKVLAFRKKLEKGKNVLFRTFNSETDFGREVDQHLRAFAHGEWEKLGHDTPEIVLPKEEVTALSKANRAGARRVQRAEARVSSSKKGNKSEQKLALVAKADLRLVKAYLEELAFARAAVDAADDGRIQDATILFAKASEGTTNTSILALAAEFFRQIGDVDNATKLVQRQAALTRDRTVAARYYMSLYPPGWMDAFRAQIEAQMLQGAEPELAAEIHSVNEEIWGGGRFEQIMLDLFVRHFSTEELTQFARSLGTAESQSALMKQQLLIADIGALVNKEVMLAMERRGYVVSPEDVPQSSIDGAVSQDAKRLSAGSNDGETG